jgi:hypothetical protein
MVRRGGDPAAGDRASIVEVFQRQGFWLALELFDGDLRLA